MTDNDPDVEAAALRAVVRARREYVRELEARAEADRLAETVGAGPRGNVVAQALADAYLAAPAWQRPDLVAATRETLGRLPDWGGGIVDDVLAGYPHPPRDRPRELGRFLARLESLREHLPLAPGALPEAEPVRVVSRAVAPTQMVRRAFHTVAIDHVGTLASLLELSIEQLAWFADARGMNRRATDHRLWHYRYLWLNGRLIEAPKPRLRAIQRWILAEVIGSIPTHPAAHGFVAGRSPHTFAAEHADRDVVIRLDVTSFFASVTVARVYGLLRSAGYPEPVAHTLAALCTTRTPVAVCRRAPAGVPDRPYRLALLRARHLPQGAPTSPALANLCAFRLDRRLLGLAQRFGVRYTRYADDLAFSGSLRPSGVAVFIERAAAICAAEGFQINARKTRIRGRGDRQALAGLVVNSAPAVPRPEYDALRALLHNAARTGLDEQNREGLADFEAYLAGRIAWVGHRHPARAAKLAALFAAARYHNRVE
jgi:hypothetical protein